VSDTLFQFTIPGQPPSWNQSYRHRTVGLVDKHGQPVLGSDLQPKRVSRLFKNKDVKAWQASVEMIARAAKPTGFAPKNQVVVGYHMYLERGLDADNVMKMLNDAIAKGIGVNDSRFLPVTLHKQSGVKNPRVVVIVADHNAWYATITANVPDTDKAPRLPDRPNMHR
jgi:Holliday junction resolvase RusA-like endonuclease